MSQLCMLFFLMASLIIGCAEYDLADSDALGRDKKTNKEEISKKIINGSLDFSHANVVAVMSQTSSCTGTIIAPKVILTAAHCVIDGGRFKNPREVWVTNSFNDRAFEAAAITQYAVHPGWYTQETPPHDVALLLLDRQLQTPAMPMFVANPLSLRGETIQAVGFGVTNGWTQTGGGQKRATTLVISDFFQGGFDATSPSGRQTDTCQGDSGGPAIVTMNGIEYVMGVVSSGPEGCIGLTHYSGLDDKAQWISGVLGQMNGSAAPPAAPPAPPASNSGGGSGPSNTGPERSTCPYVNDGECDEPTYCDVGTDTADCQNTQSSQSTPPATPPSTPPSSSSGGQGQNSPNSCRWANDHVCDEPTYCLPGTDTADCQNTQSSQSTPSSSSTGQGQNGSNSCRYANDNECDEPYFCAVGTDTADCQAAANTTSSSSASSSSSGQPAASSGPNSCRWANDNMCDEPMNCAIGTDTADCQNSSATAASQGGFGNSCTYANDGECDEPYFCALGTDQNDCANQNTSSNSYSSSSSASSSSSGTSGQRCAFANDGECDEPYYCAVGTDGNDCQ